MADDTVQLTDLEVIQQFSLAVRGATASRSDVIAALEADLAFLGSRRAAPRPLSSTPLSRSSEPAAPAKRAAAKKAPAKATRARRG
jgi:hypothetical protein